MSQAPDQSPPAPPTPARRAPPTVPGPLGVVRRKPGWPKFLGITGIVLGFFGIMSGVFNAYPMKLFGRMQSSSNALTDGIMGVYRDWQSTQTIFGLALVVAAVTLLIGSIGLFYWRGWSWLVLFSWPIFKLMLAAIGAFIGVLIQRDTTLALANAGIMPAMPTSGPDFNSIFFGLLSFLWLSVSSAFALIWLVWPSHRDEFKLWRDAEHSHISARPPA